MTTITPIGLGSDAFAMATGVQRLCADLSSNFLSGQSAEFFDVVLISRDKMHFQSCRTLLATRCRYFAHLLFRADGHAKSDSHVEVNMDSDVLKAILEYVYTGYVPVTEGGERRADLNGEGADVALVDKGDVAVLLEVYAEAKGRMRCTPLVEESIASLVRAMRMRKELTCTVIEGVWREMDGDWRQDGDEVTARHAVMREAVRNVRTHGTECFLASSCPRTECNRCGATRPGDDNSAARALRKCAEARQQCESMQHSRDDEEPRGVLELSAAALHRLLAAERALQSAADSPALGSEYWLAILAHWTTYGNYTPDNAQPHTGQIPIPSTPRPERVPPPSPSPMKPPTPSGGAWAVHRARWTHRARYAHAVQMASLLDVTEMRPSFVRGVAVPMGLLSVHQLSAAFTPAESGGCGGGCVDSAVDDRSDCGGCAHDASVLQAETLDDKWLKNWF